MTGAEVLTRFTADTSQVDKATNKFSAGLGKLTTAFTLGNVAAQVISKTISTFNQNLDSAISRFDTMNNFPKVMSNLGIGANEAQQSIDKLSEKLQGLPTSLDDAASAVQRLTSKNGNVEESTDMFLALNNAILAGGASSQIQASALEQISQAYAKGKPDMMEWRTMMMAMPAQLKQVATAMGYASADALGESLRDGTVSMDEFMNTITKLNTEGVGDFQNFEEQARNATGGIGTSITNMKTAVVRGITNMISTIDGSLESFGGLSGVISSIGKFGESIFKEIGNVLADIMPTLIEIGKSVMPVIQDVLGQILPYIKELIKRLLPPIVKLIQKIMPPIQKMASKLLPLIMNTIDALLPLLDPLIDILSAYIEMNMALIEPLMEILNVILPPLIQFLVMIINSILPVLTGLMNALGGTINWLVNTAKNLISGFVSFFTSIPEQIGNLIQNIINFFQDMPYKIGYFIGQVVGHFIKFYTQDVPNFVNNTVNVIAGLPGRIWEWMKQVPGKVWNGLVEAKNKALEGAQNIFNTIVDEFKSIPDKMREIGHNIVEGIKNGIDEKKNWLKNKLNDFGNGIVGGIKNILGIHSPSVVMKKQVGVNIGLGVIEGIEDTQKDINKAMTGVGASITGSIGLNPTTIGNMNTSTPSVNVVVNANFETDPLGQMVNNIKTFSGGSKNDYNYGMGR